MSIFGQLSRTGRWIRRETADFGLVRTGLFANPISVASVGVAEGLSSHGFFAERQNRYPSPLQGLGPIPARSLQYLWDGRLAAETGHYCANVIAYQPPSAASVRIKINSERKQACKRNPVSSQRWGCWHFRPVATRCWNRGSLGQGPGLERQSYWAAAPRPASSSARAPTSTARITAASADGGLNATYPGSRNNKHGPSGVTLPKGLFNGRVRACAIAPGATGMVRCSRKS